MKSKIVILLFCIFLFITNQAFSTNQVLHYRPEIVTITGIVRVKKFPQPPKCECIGGKAEIYRYLLLDQPIDVAPQKTDTDFYNELQKNINDVQLVPVENYNVESTDKHSNWSDKLINKHVRVTGTLCSRVIRVVMLSEDFAIIK